MQQGEDHLAELFRQNPREVVQFLRILLGVGTFTSLAMITYSFPTIVYYGGDSNLANWILYWWLGGVCVIQLAQIPLRLRMHNRLRIDVAALPRDNIIRELFDLAASLEWRLNKHIGTMAYGLFLGGSFLTSFARHLADQTDSQLQLTVVVSLAALASRMAFSFCWFFFSFIYRNDMPRLLGSNGRAADDATIAAKVRFFEWPPAQPAAPAASAAAEPIEATVAAAAVPASPASALALDTASLPRVTVASPRSPGLRGVPLAAAAASARSCPCSPLATAAGDGDGSPVDASGAAAAAAGGKSPSSTAARASLAAGIFAASAAAAECSADAAAKPCDKMGRDLEKAEARARRWAERLSKSTFLRRRRRAQAAAAAGGTGAVAGSSGVGSGTSGGRSRRSSSLDLSHLSMRRLGLAGLSALGYTSGSDRGDADGSSAGGGVGSRRQSMEGSDGWEGDDASRSVRSGGDDGSGEGARRDSRAEECADDDDDAASFSSAGGDAGGALDADDAGMGGGVRRMPAGLSFSMDDAPRGGGGGGGGPWARPAFPVCSSSGGAAAMPTPAPADSAAPAPTVAADAASDAGSDASDADGTTCAVCLADFVPGVQVAALPCNPLHVFHRECITPWLKVQKRCPLCTVDIDEPRPVA